MGRTAPKEPEPAASSAVRVRGATKSFGDVLALVDVALDVPAGQVHGIVGPNGAGKSTLLGLLLGLAVPDVGTVELLGAPVRRALALPPGVAGFVEAPGLYPAMTARQNLDALARLYGASRARVGGALEQVGLADVADDRLRGFSLGMRQRLGLAAALLAQPRLLVLDEPTNGLDPASARHVRSVLSGLADAGTAVVLSSHRMDELAALCDEVTILRSGRPVFSGPPAKLTAEVGSQDFRVRTADPAAARAVAEAVDGLGVTDSSSRASAEDAADLIVRGTVPALDELVVRLVGAGVAVRELAPVIHPLEAAFLVLTGADDERPVAGA